MLFAICECAFYDTKQIFFWICSSSNSQLHKLAVATVKSEDTNLKIFQSIIIVFACKYLTYAWCGALTVLACSLEQVRCVTITTFIQSYLIYSRLPKSVNSSNDAAVKF
jgi:hypothetical protein